MSDVTEDQLRELATEVLLKWCGPAGAVPYKVTALLAFIRAEIRETK